MKKRVNRVKILPESNRGRGPSGRWASVSAKSCRIGFSRELVESSPLLANGTVRLALCITEASIVVISDDRGYLLQRSAGGGAWVRCSNFPGNFMKVTGKLLPHGRFHTSCTKSEISILLNREV